MVAGTTERGQNGGGRRPVDSETRKAIEDAARSGLSRNAVARQFNVSPSTVTRIAREATPPISFDRTATAQAAASAVIDAKARRAQISEGLVDDVVKLRGMLFEERERVHFSVTNGEERYTSAPTAGEVKDYAIAMGILLDKHMALVKLDSDDRDLPAVDQFLLEMSGGVLS